MDHQRARQLRRDQTMVERKLWQALRDRRVRKFKFRRQQPIGPYIVDFVSLEARLIVELDGSQHGLPRNIERDRVRTRYLKERGFRVQRYWNNEVVENFDGVVEGIYRALKHDSFSGSVRPLTRDGAG